MKKMCKLILISLTLSIMIFSSSCATILGGKITSCQTQKDSPKQVRVGYLIADIVLGLVPLVVDFITNAIYKPCETTTNN